MLQWFGNKGSIRFSAIVLPVPMKLRYYLTAVVSLAILFSSAKAGSVPGLQDSPHKKPMPTFKNIDIVEPVAVIGPSQKATVFEHKDAAPNPAPPDPAPAPVTPDPVPAPVVPATPPPVVPAAPTVSSTGDPSLDWIVAHESSGNPFAINATSGACGLFQAWPCSKLGCALSDVACQIAWGLNYCNTRYGSTYNAMLFWKAHNYY